MYFQCHVLRLFAKHGEEVIVLGQLSRDFSFTNIDSNSMTTTCGLSKILVFHKTIGFSQILATSHGLISGKLPYFKGNLGL